MLSLTSYTSSHFAPLSYRLNEEQSKFTTSIDQCINQRRDLEDPDKCIVSILADETPIGFFILDKGVDRMELTDNPKSLLIRSYSINPEYQGKGYGKYVMASVETYVRKQYNNSIDELVLSVNIQNERAYHIYLKAGFEYTGRQIDGIRGAQYVLSKTINPISGK